MPQKTKKIVRVSKKAHKKHTRTLHTMRVSWFGGLLVGLVLINGTAAIQAASAHNDPGRDRAVLAYATNVSRPGLLDATNAARAANGKGPLALNSTLNNSAQAKGNDMISKDYWAHVSPNGTQPWYFFKAAGYVFTKAGENLAYGFDDSQQISDAWMNSSGHRANVLGDYKDVGFGIASGSNYQGGEYTVVVAHYGKPYIPPAPKTTTPPKTTPKATPAPTPAPAPAPTTPPTTIPSTPVETTPEPTTPTNKVAVAVQPKKVSNLEAVLGGQATWAVYSSLGLIGITTVGFAGTHWRLVKHGWKESKHFILVHPAIDTAVIAAIITLVLTSASGFIK
jgi:uncharacterized protein YkwD